MGSRSHIGIVEFYKDPGARRTGTVKTPGRTRLYVFYMNDMLSSGLLKFHSRFCTASKTKSAVAVKSESRRQMLGVQWPDVDPDNIRLKKSRRAAKASGRDNDDIAITILMLGYFPVVHDSQMRMLALQRKRMRRPRTMIPM